MARKISKKDNRYLARLVTGERAPCAFCLRAADDEITYGKLYAIGDIQCHYFCCLLSCCLIQKGHDEEGLFGFMYTDILAEVERCKKHKCSYCGRSGANLGCSVAACRKQFHVPCGRDKNAVSLYYGSYKSFCQLHAPRQSIPEHIMAKARLRMKVDRVKGKPASVANMKLDCDESIEETVCVICYETVQGFPAVNTFWPPCCKKDAWFHRTCLQRMALSAGMHYLKCPLCNDKESFYDAVLNQGYYVPDRDAAWELEQNAFAEIYERPATCAAETCLCPLGRSHDAENGKWDIKLCLLCGSAGAHAQCIDQSQPKQDTHLDQSETSQPNTLSLDQSEKTEANPSHNQSDTNEKNSSIEANGLTNEKSLALEHSSERSNIFPNKLNITDKLNTTPDTSDPTPDTSDPTPDTPDPTPDTFNTTPDTPNTCPDKQDTPLRFVCRSCLPAAPDDLNALAASIEAIIQQEQAQSTSEARRPVMPSRMSIRRSKGRRALLDRPSTSRSVIRSEADNGSSESNVVSSRLELNLKSPRRLHNNEHITRDCGVDNKLLSPYKLLEESFREKMVCTGVRDAVLDEALVDMLRHKFRKPRPMCEKKRIVNDILDGVFDDLVKDSKQKELVKEWCSPRKCFNAIEDHKEQENQYSDTSKENGDKENNSNTFNTPSKEHRNIITEDLKLNIDENINNNITECRNEVDELKNVSTQVNKNKDIKSEVPEDVNGDNSKYSDVNLNYTKTVVIPEQCNLSGNLNTQFDTDIGKSGQPIENNCEMENASSVTVTNDTNQNENCENESNIIEISNSDSGDCKKTRNAIKLLIYSGNVSNKRSNSKEIVSEIQQQKQNCEDNGELKQSIYKSLFSEDFVNTEKDLTINKSEKQIKLSDKDNFTKKSLSLKRKHSKDKRRLKRIDKSKHIASKKDTNKDKHKICSTSDSSTDISMLKKLLTDKDMCSQLLQELTTGKVDNKNVSTNSSCFGTQEMVNKVLNNSNKTSKSLHETPKHNKTSKSTDKTQRRHETTTDLNNTSKHSSKKRTDSKTCFKTTTDSDESRKSSHQAKEHLERRSSTSKGSDSYKDKHKIHTTSNSSSGFSMLQKLLTEKDMCSQLLLELTTGKVDDKNVTTNSNCSGTQEIVDKAQNYSFKSLQETPKHKRPLRSSDKNQRQNETSKASTDTTSKHSVERPKSSQQTKERLKRRSSTSKLKTKHLNKTTKRKQKSPKSQDIRKDSNQTQSLTEANLEISPNSSIDTPKHKTIEIKQNSSLEISENDQHINIDVIKIVESPTAGDSYKNLKIKLPDQLKTCFKFSPIEDTLDKNDIGIDLESFKKEYLNEVDREFKCGFKHKHDKKASVERQFRSPIDFAMDAAIKKEVDYSDSNSQKRKLSESAMKLVFAKRRKTSEGDLKLSYDYDKTILENSRYTDKITVDNKREKRDKDKRRKRETKERRKAKRNKRRSSIDKNIEVTIDSSEKRSDKIKKLKKKIRTKFAIQNENIQVKIKWKKEHLSLNIESKTQSKKEKKVNEDRSKFKQYVLQFPEGHSKEVLIKPEKEVSPLKRKYVRNEKSSDNLKQMSIQSFFKLKAEK